MYACYVKTWKEILGSKQVLIVKESIYSRNLTIRYDDALLLDMFGIGSIKSNREKK